MKGFKTPPLVIVSILLIGITFLPQNALGFWDEESWKITGIALGASLALGIVIVLVAGTIDDLKGNDDYSFDPLDPESLLYQSSDPVGLIHGLIAGNLMPDKGKALQSSSEKGFVALESYRDLTSGTVIIDRLVVEKR